MHVMCFKGQHAECPDAKADKGGCSCPCHLAETPKSQSAAWQAEAHDMARDMTVAKDKDEIIRDLCEALQHAQTQLRDRDWPERELHEPVAETLRRGRKALEAAGLPDMEPEESDE